MERRFGEVGHRPKANRPVITTSGDPAAIRGNGHNTDITPPVARQQVGLLTGHRTDADRSEKVARNHQLSAGVETAESSRVRARVLGQLVGLIRVQVVNPDSAFIPQQESATFRGEVVEVEVGKPCVREIDLLHDARLTLCEMPAA